MKEGKTETVQKRPNPMTARKEVIKEPSTNGRTTNIKSTSQKSNSNI